jgi:hypothetical protein
MDVLNPMTYDAEEDQLRERTKYSEMDKHLIPAEFRQQPVSTGVRHVFFIDIEVKKLIIFRQQLLRLNMMEESFLVLTHVLHQGRIN